jgi:hypothetical protein
MFSDWYFNLLYLKNLNSFYYIDKDIFEYRNHINQFVKKISKFYSLKMYYNILILLNVNTKSFIYLIFRKFIANYFFFLKEFIIVKRVMKIFDMKVKG